VEGSGLGLSIAAALVTASNGRFEVSAAVPHGVRARIRLPAARATAPDSGEAGRTTPTGSDVSGE
jgi:signal transduction histidine kinase